ncbi:MAG: twin-arginine translocation signal domain-containing protein, partial [Rubrobacteraceae bacterium]
NRRLLSRRDFLAGLSGAALLGVAGCASEQSEGLARIVFSHGEDSEILRDQIRRFNEHNRGTIEVALRLASADRGPKGRSVLTQGVWRSLAAC